MNIDRRTFITGVGSAAVLGALGSLPHLPAEEPPGGDRRPPNILVLFSDQHSGMVMGCGGDDQVQTPHMDTLAGDGAYFPYCVSNHPVCCPQRATVMTGLYAHRHGLKRNDVRLDADHRHFAQVFAAAGYATGYCGKWHLDGGNPGNANGIVPPERRRGWQDWHGYEKGHSFTTVYDFDDEKRFELPDRDWEPAWHTDLVLEFAKRNRDAGKPWLYFCSYGPPHLPTQCPQSWLDMYPQVDLTLNPAQEKRCRGMEDLLRKAMQMYYGQVSAIDHEIGRVRAGLQKLGIDDNTIVIYTADHGDLLGTRGRWRESFAKRGKPELDLRGKCEPYAWSSRVPFMVAGPGIATGRHTLPVSGVDLAPTLLSLAGLETPAAMQGTDLAGLLGGGAVPEMDAAWMALYGWEAIFDGTHLYAPMQKVCYNWATDRYELDNRWHDKALRARLAETMRTVKQRIDA